MLRGLVLASLIVGATSAGAELAPPAEFPPSDYAGQQYVDSKGCLFVRAGQDPGQEVWVPRVTREGKPLCGNPPSGQRVPVVEDGAVAGAEPTADLSEDVSLPAEDASDAVALTASGYFVAVGSFGVAANAGAAEARLKALNYPVARGRMGAGSADLITVFAGPFTDADHAARALLELKGAGFPDAMLIAP